MMTSYQGVALLGLVGDSGAGKTTLLAALIPRLNAGGRRIGCIKHTHHAFDIDLPGKDSQVLRMAGARQVLLGSPTRWALMVEIETDDSFMTFLSRLQLTQLDLVLVEGFKLEQIPQIEVHRIECTGKLSTPSTDCVIAIATNQKPVPNALLPVFDLDRPEPIADFIQTHIAALERLQSDGGTA